MRPTLVLLPGTLCDALLWQPQCAALANETRCVVGDLTRSDTLAGAARDVLAQVEGAFALAGLSYGGIVALEIWRQARQRVQRLALLNTNHRATSDETRARQQALLAMALAGKFREVTTDHLKDRMLAPSHRHHLPLRRTVLQMAENVGLRGYINQIKAQLNRPDSTPDLPRITCPTLLLTGAEDTVCPPELHHEMAGLIPTARLVVLANCGHLSTLEQPDAVTAALREWLHWEKTA
jgi:pimeloyl-ACP methyl ester carboxylesterase